jgi:RNA polymerase sigma-70 factor (ECF subfamily)
VTAAERSDADLLRAHAAGDAVAFEELVRRHRDRLWAVALRTMRDREEAADALQDALISAYKAAGSFRGDSAVTTWLHRIVVNACLDRMRRRQTRATVPLPEEGPHEPADSRDRVAERDTRMVVEEALRQLPPEQRAAIVLVDVEGWSVAETATMLGVPEGTVKSRCARGRARLAVLLGHLRNLDAPPPVPPRAGSASGGDSGTEPAGDPGGRSASGSGGRSASGSGGRSGSRSGSGEEAR